MAKEQSLKAKNIKKVLIMASGNGSNFEAIIKYFDNKGLGDAVSFELLSDNKNARVLERAKNLNIPAFSIKFDEFATFLKNRKYDLYVLAGFMRVLPDEILQIIKGSEKKENIINIHPSLLPEFKGKNAIKRAFEANVKKTGITIHFVNEKLDGGKIIEQRALPVSNLSFEALESEIHALEHSIYPEIIEKLLFKKNVLIFGGGAREHAIAEKILSSPYLNRLYLAKANDGFKNLGETIDFTDYFDLLEKAKEKNIDLLIVGPENPLIDGISDIFENSGIKTIGANKSWARLEGSKIFAKEFMKKNDIKTADFFAANTIETAFKAIETFKNATPPVIKADGPALGKGVELPKTLSEARKTAKTFLDGKFGDASKEILIEERLFGKEISIMSLWDGDTLLSFPPACDYKRLLDGNKGLNTGGMGSFAPAYLNQKEKLQIKKYLKKLECALKNEKADFSGIIYSGLILTASGVYVLEYNMRFGDPEIQSLLELLENDLLYVFLKMSEKRLCDVNLKFNRKRAFCLTLASCGYPENPVKGSKISGLENGKKYACKIYFAGVKSSSNGLVSNGGRVLSIVKSGKNALIDIYKTAKLINYAGKIFRKDIGK